MSDLIVKYASVKLSELFCQARQQLSTHIEFLDPLCTILKLCILNYKPVGTKISIQKNCITIQESTFSQSLIRSFYNDSRNQLYQLKHPILYFKAIESGILDIEISDEMKSIFVYLKNNATLGLIKLKSTYEINWKDSTSVKSCISDYIRILQSTNYTIEDLKIETTNIERSLLLNIYNEFFKFWSIDDLKPIYLIMLNIEEKNKLSGFSDSINIDYYFKSIEYLIDAKESEINVSR